MSRLATPSCTRIPGSVARDTDTEAPRGPTVPVLAEASQARTLRGVEGSRRRALGIIRSEALLRDRAALDAIATGVWLTEREPIDEEETERVLTEIQARLPVGIRDDSRLAEDDDGHLTLQIDGGTVIAILPMRGGGEDWVVAVFATVITEEPVEGLDIGVVDAINARVPGMLFVNTGTHAAFHGAIPGRLERLDGAWAELVGAVALENHARGRRFAGDLAGLAEDDDPVVRYWKAEHVVADDGDPMAGHAELTAAMRRYVDGTPAETRPLLRVRERREATHLDLPYPRRDGTERLVLSGRYIDVDSGLDWAPAGYHYFHEMPEEMTREEALRRCESLNGMGPEVSERSQVTTPWLLGSWQTTPGEHGWRILFHGYVPTTLRDRVDLTQVTAGIVREVWQGRRKMEALVEFERTFRAEEEA